MEVGGNTNTGSSLPPNYVSLFELRERWLQKKAAEQRDREKSEEEKQKSEEERKSEAEVHGRAKKEEYGPKVDETPQTTEAQSRPSNKLHGPKQKSNRRSGNYGRTAAADRVPEPASKETETEASAQVREATKKVGGVVEWERNHGRENKRDRRRRQKKTYRSLGRAGTGADPESEKRAAMAVPVVGRGEHGRGVGVYDSGIAEGKVMERKNSVDRFSEEGPCRRRQKETSRSQGRAGAGAGASAGAESEKRAAMVVPAVGRGQREREIGVYDSGVAEGKANAMERKGSVNRFSEVEKKFEKLSTSEGDERGRHRSGMDHEGGFRRRIGNYGRRSNSYRSEAPRLSTRHGVAWVKKGEGSSGGDGKQEDDHGFTQCD